MLNADEDRRQTPTGECGDYLLSSSSIHVQTVLTLAHRLRGRRRACGLTPDQLAQQSGVPLDELVAMESGLTSTPYFTSVALLARVLGIDVRWLYYGTADGPEEP